MIKPRCGSLKNGYLFFVLFFVEDDKNWNLFDAATALRRRHKGTKWLAWLVIERGYPTPS